MRPWLLKYCVYHNEARENPVYFIEQGNKISMAKSVSGGKKESKTTKTNYMIYDVNILNLHMRNFAYQPKNCAMATCCRGEACQHVDQSCLPGPVVTQQACYLTHIHVQSKPCQEHQFQRLVTS